MDYEDIIATILASIIVLCFIAVCVYWFIRYGTKEIELEHKRRKKQIEFYDMATKLIENKLNLEIELRKENDGNKQAN